MSDSHLSSIITDITENWEVAQRLLPGRDIFQLSGGEKTWFPAAVPGHVHRDLVRAGVIADPFYRLGEMGAQWVDDADWTYRTTFAVDAERLAARGEWGRHFLNFGGLDTIARIYLNEVLIGETENGYIEHRFDVTDTLRAGNNALRIEFDSAIRIGNDRARAYLGDGTSSRGTQSYFNFGPRAFVRKPQYEFGWDWGPELVGVGITGPVELITVPNAEITDWHLRYTFIDPITVDMTVRLTVTKYTPEPLTAGIALYAAGDNTPEAELPDAPGTYTVELPVYGQKVAPWNPNGQDILSTLSLSMKPKGDAQKRYLLNLRVWKTLEDPYDEKEFVAHKGVTVGFRKVELVREPDSDGKGESFLFRVNGAETFIRGANWIPSNCFPATITREELRQRLTLARDAGFNMLRVWGGGLYESEDFYNLCDELGLLVWQDFPFACSMYPDDLPQFTEAVRVEAITAIKRIRHRASLALWCGGNENLQLHQQRWAEGQATEFFGAQTVFETLPELLAEHDPDTAYWANSPYSGEKERESQSDERGDAHYWNVWHGEGDWINYAKNNCRFSSEFGFAASCGFAAWESCTSEGDREPRSLVARWHDKTRKGYETYLAYTELHFPKVETWDDLVYYTQANQAMALSYGVEHWRRRKGRCWGTLFWQLNDCWPTQSWAVVDSTGEGKIAYHAAKRTFYAPILVSLVERDGQVEAHVVNDTLLPVKGRLTFSLEAYSGGVSAWSETIDVDIPANAANDDIAKIAAPITETVGANRDRFYFRAVLTAPDATTVLGENVLLLSEPKDAALEDPNIAMHVDKKGDTATITLTAAKFAAFVHLRWEGDARFSDNGFHLLPGETKTVTLSGPGVNDAGENFAGEIRLRHLAS